MSLALLAACCGSVAAAVVDARTGLLPDRIVVPTACIALLCAAAAGSSTVALAGGSICGGALLVPFVVTRGRGLGLGDVKLAAAVGCGLGPVAGAAALGAAFVAGGAYGALLLATGRATRRTAIRFGPFLAGGTLVAALGAALT